MKKSWKSFMTVTAAAAAMTAAMAFSSLAAVAKVGTQEFNNLQDAINSAGESPVVIDLEENVSLTDGLVIGAGKNVTIQCGTSDQKTIKMEGKGIHTEGTYDATAKSWNTSRLTFKNCVLDITANDNPGGSGGTANLISNTDLTLDHVTWTQNSADGGSGSGMYLYQESNLYLVNGTVMTISGYKGSRASGIFADNSEYDDMPNRSIKISDYSSLNITDCDWHGMTVNPVDVTVEKYSHIDITGCGNPNYGGGIGCYYGKLSVTDHSDVTTNQNIGSAWGIFVKELFVDGTSKLISCRNTGNGLDVGGKGTIEGGAEISLDGNGKRGLQVYSGSDYWYGDVEVKAGAIVSVCENRSNGILNTYKLFVENGATLKVEENHDRGIRNVRELTLNAGSVCKNQTGSTGAGIFNEGTLKIGTGVRICNNRAATSGGGLYNGENGTAELSDGVILYNNHAAKGADDIYNTAGRKLTFCAVGTGWNLDDCNHRIDGWYDDTEGSRWNADDNLPENRHIVSVASGEYETGFQIKAAHGAEIYETTSYPIDKKADGEDEIGTVSQGKKIRFTLTSSLPKLLARYVVTASNASPANSAREIRKVRVHSASGAGTVRVHSASGAETVRVYSASGARRARSVSGDNYDNEISAQSLSADEKYAIPDSVVETMVFHDEMNRYLKFIDSTLRVTAGRDGKEVPSGYYTVTASGSNAFRVEVDLVNLFNTGIIDYEDLTDENPITVTYEAVVTDDAIQGDELFNEAWVNDGEHDSVEGDVLDKKVPSTGGMGRGMFTGLGLLFMGTAAAAWKRKRSM